MGSAHIRSGVKQRSEAWHGWMGVRGHAGCSMGGVSAGVALRSGRVHIQQVLWGACFPPAILRGLRGLRARPQSTSAESPQRLPAGSPAPALRLPPDCCHPGGHPEGRRIVCALERGAGTQDSALLLPLLPGPRRWEHGVICPGLHRGRRRPWAPRKAARTCPTHRRINSPSDHSAKVECALIHANGSEAGRNEIYNQYGNTSTP